MVPRRKLKISVVQKIETHKSSVNLFIFISHQSSEFVLWIRTEHHTQYYVHANGILWEFVKPSLLRYTERPKFINIGILGTLYSNICDTCIFGGTCSVRHIKTGKGKDDTCESYRVFVFYKTFTDLQHKILVQVFPKLWEG